MKLFFLTLITLFFIQAYCHAKSKVVNIYSARQEVLMRELIDNFEVKENIKVNIIFSKANQLIKKIEMEGEYTDADILLTVDVARLLSAKKKGLFKTIDSSILKNQIPSICGKTPKYSSLDFNGFLWMQNCLSENVWVQLYLLHPHLRDP